MPRLFIHLHDGDGWLYDAEGRDLGDTSTVAALVLSEARAVIAADVMAGLPVQAGSFVAADNSEGVEVARVSFGEAFSVVGL
jgi:hypothetical protein